MAYLCSTPKCPVIIPKAGKCDKHRQEADKARGNRYERGYGLAHDKLRAQWAPQVATGTVKCARCHNLIEPGTPWALDHADDRASYLGPSHAHCNNSAGGKLAEPSWMRT